MTSIKTLQALRKIAGTSTTTPQFFQPGATPTPTESAAIDVSKDFPQYTPYQIAHYYSRYKTKPSPTAAARYPFIQPMIDRLEPKPQPAPEVTSGFENRVNRAVDGGSSRAPRSRDFR